jgi:hypothetical protein
MDAHWKIERYAAYVRSPSLGSGGNAVPHIILLLGPETGQRAYLYFLNDMQQKPSNRYTGAYWAGYFNRSQYSEILDLLRNEMPVYFHFNETIGHAQLQTALETAGVGDEDYASPHDE